MGIVTRKKPKKPTLRDLWREYLGLYPVKETKTKVARFREAAKKHGYRKSSIDTFIKLPG